MLVNICLVSLILWAIPIVGMAQTDSVMGVALPEVSIIPKAAAWIGFEGHRISKGALHINSPSAIVQTAIVFPVSQVNGKTITAIQLYIHPLSVIGGRYRLAAYLGDCVPGDCVIAYWSQECTALTTGWTIVPVDIRVQGQLTLIISSEEKVGVALAKSIDPSFGYIYTQRSKWQSLQEFEYRPGKPVHHKPAVKLRIE